MSDKKTVHTLFVPRTIVEEVPYNFPIIRKLIHDLPHDKRSPTAVLEQHFRIDYVDRAVVKVSRITVYGEGVGTSIRLLTHAFANEAMLETDLYEAASHSDWLDACQAVHRAGRDLEIGRL